MDRAAGVSPRVAIASLGGVAKVLMNRAICSLLVLLGEDVGQAALAAVLTVEVAGHADAGAAHLVRAFPPEACDLAVLVNLVVLEYSKFDLLLLVLDLLRLGVHLLLPL